jgi:hypothetical protein
MQKVIQAIKEEIMAVFLLNYASESQATIRFYAILTVFLLFIVNKIFV